MYCDAIIDLITFQMIQQNNISIYNLYFYNIIELFNKVYESLQSTGYLPINLSALVERPELQYSKLPQCSLIVHTNRKFDHKTWLYCYATQLAYIFKNIIYCCRLYLFMITGQSWRRGTKGDCKRDWM